jgi:hypothetical protein
LTLSFWIKSANGSNQTISFHYAGGNRSTINVTNEWQRVEYGEATGAGVGYFGAEIRGTITDQSADVYLYGWQLEKSLVATDYIETGASTAQAGILEDLPRLDYSGGASCPSLLLEPQRTNLLAQSEYFNTYYSLTSNSVTDNYGTSPEGNSNSSLFTLSGTNGTANIVVASNGQHTLSAFFKSGTTDIARLQFYDSGVGSSAVVEFNLTTQVVTKLGQTSTADIEDYGNGWYRCWISRDLQGTNNTIYFGGNGVSGKNLEVYGSQVEAGSYPTSYIPTMGSAVTRDLEYGVSDVSSLLTSNEGTLFIHLNDGANSNGYGSGALSVGLQNNTGSNFVGWASNSPNPAELRAIYKVNGAIYYMGSSTPVNTECKILVRWGNGYASFFKNGILFNQQSTANFTGQPLVDFLLPNQFRTGNFPIKQTLVFPTALTDSECIALTTI